jgi:hypothetical protein
MSEAKAVSAGESPWRFLTALDAANPGDQELLKATRGDELELVRNMILSAKTTVLYAFSGNGKSSLISAGIIPTFRRSGYAVFRTRPRPAMSLVTPSQAFKDCILAEFWLPPQSRVDTLVANAQAALAETAPEIRSILDPLLTKVNAVLMSGQGADFQAEEFRRHFKERASLPLPEFVEQIQNWVGKEVHLLFVLDQFEELFVHYYNTPEMAAFVADLGKIYASPNGKASFLFSMREDWVGSMVQLRHEIPTILSNCFKLEPLRVSQAAVALQETTRRVGAQFETGVAECILRDLSAFYSVLQKQSFAAVHLTPSRMADPYVELPAVQVLMEHLWNSIDPSDASGMCITMKAYQKIAPPGTENPAGYFLENYLKDFLEGLPARVSLPGDRSPEKLNETETGSLLDRAVLGAKELTDLRLDLLYLLTDRYAHRRAVSDFTLLAEAREIRKADVTQIEARQLEMADIEAALTPLMEGRLVYSAPGLRGVRHYELAHDFLVRSVVRLWQQLAERRAEERFRYVQSQEQGRARLKELSGLSLRVRGLLIGESVLTVLSIWAIPLVWLMQGSYPEAEWFALAMISPVLLLFNGTVLGCWPAAAQGAASVAAIISILSFPDLHYSNGWSGYLMNLIVITVYLATGVVAWSVGMSKSGAGKTEWKKIAATAFDYACILIAYSVVLLGSDRPYNSVSSFGRISGTFLFPVAAVWLGSQAVSIASRQASLGNVLFGLRRMAEDGSTARVWIREAIGQAGLLAFAIANWGMLAGLEYSHWADRLFVGLHLGILGGFMWVTFRKPASWQFAGRWSKTRVVNRGDAAPAATGGQGKTAIAGGEGPRPAHGELA